jgi:hypothetical protein
VAEHRLVVGTSDERHVCSDWQAHHPRADARRRR